MSDLARGPGKPTTLTPEVQEAICKYIRSGASVPKAAVAAGVSVNTVKSWRREGRAGKQPFKDFLEACDHAFAVCCTGMAGAVTNAAKKGDSRAAMWWLNHRDPAFAPPRFKHDVTVDWAPSLRKFLMGVRQRVKVGDPQFKELTVGGVDEVLKSMAESSEVQP